MGCLLPLVVVALTPFVAGTYFYAIKCGGSRSECEADGETAAELFPFFFLPWAVLLLMLALLLCWKAAAPLRRRRR